VSSAEVVPVVVRLPRRRYEQLLGVAQRGGHGTVARLLEVLLEEICARYFDDRWGPNEVLFAELKRLREEVRELRAGLEELRVELMRGLAPRALPAPAPQAVPQALEVPDFVDGNPWLQVLRLRA